jgi:hypothetical protein
MTGWKKWRRYPMLKASLKVATTLSIANAVAIRTEMPLSVYLSRFVTDGILTEF